MQKCKLQPIPHLKIIVVHDLTQVDLNLKIPKSSKVKLHLFGQMGLSEKDNVVTWLFTTNEDQIMFCMRPWENQAMVASNWCGNLKLDESQIIKVERIGKLPQGNFSLVLTIMGYYE